MDRRKLDLKATIIDNESRAVLTSGMIQSERP